MTVANDASYDPPAPVLTATLTSVLHRRPQMRLPALIDTGSDITAIPSTVVKRLHLYAVGRMGVEGIDAFITTTEIYTIRLTITGQPAREIEVVATEQPFVILGRDWLQTYYLLLNGPDRNFLLSETPLITAK
jgi:predicted aspartyl protease